jgi:hypothetical protein
LYKNSETVNHSFLTPRQIELLARQNDSRITAMHTQKGSGDENPQTYKLVLFTMFHNKAKEIKACHDPLQFYMAHEFVFRPILF